MDVWLNGQLVPSEQASVAVFDAGFQHGVGLFETLCVYNGRVFRPMEHVQRIVASAKQLHLSEKIRVEPLIEAIQKTVAHNKLDRARVRLTITGGNLNMLQSGNTREHDPTVLVVIQPPTPYPDAFFEKGIGVTIAPGRLSPWLPSAGHKTLDYWSRILALQEAAACRAGESLWLTPEANVACGSVSNIFLVQDDVLLTPPSRTEATADSPSPVLPGVTRAAILELSSGRTIERRNLSLDDLVAADEIFLTNSSWQVLPVTSLLLRTKKEGGDEGEDSISLEHRPVGEDGGVGSVTSDLRTALLALIDRETSSED